VSFAGGIIAALGATSAINGGTVIMKRAMAKAPAQGAVLVRLAREPLWLSGLFLQLMVGAPLTITATALIGPAMTPGIMAFGLAILAILSDKVNGESIGKREISGIAIVMIAVLLIAASALTVDVGERHFLERDLVIRMGIVAGACGGISLILALIGFKFEKDQDRAKTAALLALANGFLVGLSNLLLGPLAAAIARLVEGHLSAGEISFLLGAAVAVAILNVLILGISQRALRAGDASIVIPVQQGPIQLIPILSFFLVYKPFEPPVIHIISASSGAALVLIGATILAAPSGK